MKKRLLAIFLVAIFLFGAASVYASDANEFTLSVKQQSINYLTVDIEISDAQDIIESADSLNITASMYYDGNEAQSISFQQAPADAASIEVPYYGEWEIKAEFIKDNEVIASQTQNVGVVAQAYNVAPPHCDHAGTYFRSEIFL